MPQQEEFSNLDFSGSSPGKIGLAALSSTYLIPQRESLSSSGSWLLFFIIVFDGQRLMIMLKYLDIRSQAKTFLCNLTFIQRFKTF